MMKTKAKSINYKYDDVAIGFSGGIRSYCLLLDAMRRYKTVSAVYVDWGQASNLKERRVFTMMKKRNDYAVKEAFNTMRLDRPESVVEFKFLKFDYGGVYGQYWNGRNLLIARECARFSTNVIIGECWRPHNLLRSEETWWNFERYSALVSLYRGESVTVDRWSFNKDANYFVAREFGKGTLTREIANRLSYCENPYKIDCGNCYGCFKKERLFTNMSWDDDLKFERPIMQADKITLYFQRYYLSHGY